VITPDIQFPLQDRGDKPSCSSFGRYSLCAGSYQIGLLVPRDEGGPEAKLGTDVHAALAGEKVENLSEEGENLYNLCRWHLAKLQDEVMGDEVSFQTRVEQRLWWGDEWSGQADRIDLWDENALVVDYKTGRGEVEPAERNLQLRGLAVLAKRRLPHLKKVFVAIIAPMAGGVTLAEYDEESLAAATEEVLDIIKTISEEHAPRTPAPSACKYCPAKSVCPEVSEKAITLPVSPAPVTLTTEKLSELLVVAEYVEDYIMALRTEAKNRLTQGVPVKGWYMKDGAKKRAIEDPTAAYNILAEKMSPEDFAGACSVSVPSLEKAYAKATGLKGKAAKEAFEAELAPVITTKQNASSLAREVAP
jgi:CRISPR/Cas system-associated exonuclease Cas4 (RecB family)